MLMVIDRIVRLVIWTRVTGLTGILLDKYKMQYKPSYEFLITATELEFYEYILSTANKFKKQEGIN